MTEKKKEQPGADGNHKSETEKEAKAKLKPLERLFSGIGLSWPILIVTSVIIGVFVGILMCIPALTDTSFTRIGVIMYWWVFFGTIIITNSKSELDSALKCFIFFLISQPLIYLTQIVINFCLNPANGLDWSLFNYYKTWFYWTLATAPMGFAGYWLIKRRNTLSILALAPAMAIVMLEGLGEFSATIANFPKYLISGLYCVVILAVMTLGILKGWRLRSLLLAAVAAVTAIFYLASVPRPEDYVFSFEWEVSEYGVTTEQEWSLESELGERLSLQKADNVDENGDKTGEQFYYLHLGGNGYDIGRHGIKLISPTRTVNCTIDIVENNRTINNSFTCEK